MTSQPANVSSPGPRRISFRKLERSVSDMINKVPATTTDFTTEAANKLAELFPEVVADGKVDIDKLKTILGVDVDDARERFGLTWPGKAQAIRAAQTPTTATLEPDKENSVDWDTTQNVFIEGDNLEVLKILQKHYYGQIKMIYIDPPYNTGNDFVYSDNYADPLASYLEQTGQADEGGKLSTKSDSTGRFHSNWLNMMYPRLKLARNLLRNDGCIAVSIDDAEASHLCGILDEIFGESNRVGVFSIIRAEGGGLAKQMIKGHDSLFVYARSLSSFKPLLRPKDIRGNTVTIDGEDYWIEEDWLRKEFGKYGTCMYEEILQYHGQSKKDEIDKGLAEGKYTLLAKPGGFHVVGRYRKVSEDGSKFYSVIKHLNKNGNSDLKALGADLARAFDYPKPTSLIQQFVLGATFFSSDHDAMVLDFFAGSGTTAHAVMQLNANDGGTRRCISVQLPERTGEKSEARKAGYETISEITRERIMRAGAKILKDEAENLANRTEPLDVGFRAYKLVDTNFTKWKASSSLSEDELVGLFSDLADSTDDHARPEALLTEVLLKLGFSLTEEIKTINVAGLSVFSVADGLAMAYLDEHTQPTLDQLRALVAEEPERLVVLEDAFQGNDELKTNLVQECRTRNVDLWTA